LTYKRDTLDDTAQIRVYQAQFLLTNNNLACGNENPDGSYMCSPTQYNVSLDPTAPKVSCSSGTLYPTCSFAVDVVQKNMTVGDFKKLT